MPKYDQNNRGLKTCLSLTDKFQMMQVSRHTDTDQDTTGQA